MFPLHDLIVSQIEFVSKAPPLQPRPTLDFVLALAQRFSASDI